MNVMFRPDGSLNAIGFGILSETLQHIITQQLHKPSPLRFRGRLNANHRRSIAHHNNQWRVTVAYGNRDPKEVLCDMVEGTTRTLGIPKGVLVKQLNQILQNPNLELVEQETLPT